MTQVLISKQRKVACEPRPHHPRQVYSRPANARGPARTQRDVERAQQKRRGMGLVHVRVGAIRMAESEGATALRGTAAL